MTQTTAATVGGDRRDTTLGPRRARPALAHLSGARAGVLHALTAMGDAVTVAVLAEQLSQHPNTVREHLDALVADGRVERFRRAPSGRGRPAWLYRAATLSPADSHEDLMSGPLGADGQEYIALALALIDQVSTSSPDPRGMARQAGERWGRSLAERYTEPTASDEPRDPKARIVELLRELRFETQAGADPKQMRLVTCPFLDAAKRHPEVVCQIHLGIVRGAMQRLGGDPNAADLTAFAEPGACLLSLPDAR